MTSARRPVVRRTRPASVSGVTVVPVAGSGSAQVVDVEQPVSASNSEDTLRQQVVDDFESSLREQRDVEADDLEQLLSMFKDAVDEMPLEAEFKPLDPRDLEETLDALVQNGVLDADDRNTLGRTLNEALRPLQRPQVQLAAEYAARCERDGEEAALAWYENERRKLNGQASSLASGKPGQEHSGTSANDSITSSKSRRLRGPPRR